MKGRKGIAKKRLLVIADFPHETGFGVVAMNLLKQWKTKYDVSIMGINYYGDFHPLTHEFKAYPASIGGSDIYGIQRLPEVLQTTQADHIFIINDIWIAKEYVDTLKQYKEACVKFGKECRVFLYTPIDAINVKELFVTPCNDVFDIVFPYTQFGDTVLRQAGLTTQTVVVPHGVDATQYKPMSKIDARIMLKLPLDAYIVLMVARNQPRKRIDLAFYYFSEWVHRYNLPANVMFYYHGSLYDPVGYDIMNLARVFNVRDRLILSSADMRPDTLLPREHVNRMYNCADIHWMTSTGEG